MINEKKQASFIQFSKRLATWITIFWCAFRLISLVITAFKPEMEGVILGMLTGIDNVMMINVGFYCGNSVAEKGISGYVAAKTATAEEEMTEG